MAGLPTRVDDLVLSQHAGNLSQTLSALRRSTLSVRNRLHSIFADSAFVASVQAQLQLPLIANERCGSWYIPPNLKTGSAYFKSTDGHHGQWAFSHRRLNLHLLPLIEQHQGCIIVDSTRRGKSMPDALSKTVPIWCAVLNRLQNHSVPVSLPETIGPSEQAQIHARIDLLVEQANVILSKPLRPLWTTPDSTIEIARTRDYYPIICCTASRQGLGVEDVYVQGAADDSEGWAQHLTATLFWHHHEQLLAMNDEDLADWCATCVQEKAPSGIVHIAGTRIAIGTVNDCSQAYDATIACQKSSGLDEPHCLRLACNAGKLGSRQLRQQLERLPPFLHSVRARRGDSASILVTCLNGRDLSVGVALVVLLLQEGHKRVSQPMDKVTIRRTLAHITASKPDVSPSRATLQSVNAYLMPSGV